MWFFNNLIDYRISVGWFSFMAYQPLWLINAKSCFYIYIKYMICKYIFWNIQLNDQTVLFQTIQFSQRQIVPSITMYH